MASGGGCVLAVSCVPMRLPRLQPILAVRGENADLQMLTWLVTELL